MVDRSPICRIESRAKGLVQRGHLNLFSLRPATTRTPRTAARRTTKTLQSGPRQSSVFGISSKPTMPIANTPIGTSHNVSAMRSNRTARQRAAQALSYAGSDIGA